MSGPDRLLLAALAVFAGEAAPSTVRAVMTAAGVDAVSVDSGASTLAATSLITVAHRDGAARITMLETVREIAREVLATSSYGDALLRAHAQHMLGLVRDSVGADAVEALDSRIDDIRAGLAWTIANEPAVIDPPLIRALTSHLLSRSRFGEARRTLTAIAEATPGVATQARAWLGAGIAANENGDHTAAIEYAHRAAALFDEVADPAGRAAALTLAGNGHKALGAHEPAIAAHTECLELARTIGDLPRASIALNNLGTLAHDCGELAMAYRHYAESLQIKVDLKDERGIAVAQVNLGGLANDLGEYAQARQHLGRAAATFTAIGEQHSLAFALSLLAEAELGAGETVSAAASAAQALTLARESEHRPTIGLALSRHAACVAALGDDAAAAGLYEDALEYVSGAPEIARTLEHLAEVRVRSSPLPDEAMRLLRDAEEIRRSGKITAPPVSRAIADRIRRR